jgi:hypothetical protein
MRRWASILTVSAAPLAAQCVMCARTAAAQNEARISVLMQGVVVLLVPPLVILSGFLYLAWRRR